MIEEYPNMLLTLTWCHRTPADTPTRVSTIIAISLEHQLDDVACACYVGRKGVATALLHQGRTVHPVCDCQVVVATGGMVFNVECSEMQRKDLSLLHCYHLCLLNVAWVFVGVVWRGDFTSFTTLKAINNYSTF